MFVPGELVAEHVQPHDGGELAVRQIQPNGVDLSIDLIYDVKGQPVIEDGDEYSKGEREEAKIVDDGLTQRTTLDENSTYYKLNTGRYVIQYNEEIHIPEGHVGMVFPRSRFMRSGAHITTALWDMGYEGRGEGGLLVFGSMFVEKGMPAAQLTLITADAEHMYDGSHQGEKLHRDGD